MSNNNSEPRTETLAETENFLAWEAEEPDGETTYHIAYAQVFLVDPSKAVRPPTQILPGGCTGLKKTAYDRSTTCIVVDKPADPVTNETSK